MSFFIHDAMAQTSPAGPSGGVGVDFWIFMIGMVAIMYFMIIRPQRKRQKEHESLVTALGKGDEVVTTSGILGKIIRMEGDYILLNTGNNVEIRFQKAAVHAVLPKGTIKDIVEDK